MTPQRWQKPLKGCSTTRPRPGLTKLVASSQALAEIASSLCALGSLGGQEVARKPRMSRMCADFHRRPSSVPSLKPPCLSKPSCPRKSAQQFGDGPSTTRSIMDSNE